MNRNGSAIILIAIIMVVLAVIAGAWYYKIHISSVAPVAAVTSTPNSTSASSSSTQFTFLCSETSTTIYENRQMGIAFCYPSDLAIATSTIVWPGVYTPPLDENSISIHPVINFGVVHDSEPIISSSSVTGGVPALSSNLNLAGCWAGGGKYKEIWCAFPTQSQITENKNENGLEYIFFRYDMVSTAVPVISSDAGPFAYIALPKENYLYFSADNFNILPSYVDADLKTILSTVKTIP